LPITQKGHKTVKVYDCCLLYFICHNLLLNVTYVGEFMGSDQYAKSRLLLYLRSAKPCSCKGCRPKCWLKLTVQALWTSEGFEDASK